MTEPELAVLVEYVRAEVALVVAQAVDHHESYYHDSDEYFHRAERAARDEAWQKLTALVE